MEIKNELKKVDEMVSQGDIVNAVKNHFAPEAITSDYNGLKTSNQQEMIEKMEGFVGSIKTVNGITHHNSILENNVSASEFTFDFKMNDGSDIFWHEIIKREWDNNGKIIKEEYFNAG